MRLIIIIIANSYHLQYNKLTIKEIMKKITIAAIIFAIWTSISIANEVNVFSARHYDSDIQLYEKFTNKTGIKVNIVSG